jgi:hypothetical protein
MASHMLDKHSTLGYIPRPWFFEIGSHCIAQAGLELAILLTLPSGMCHHAWCLHCSLLL